MSAETTKVKDVVCGMMIDPMTAAAVRIHEGKTYHFAHRAAQGRSTRNRS